MKKQLKFKVTRKGYDVAEVDNYLAAEADKNEKIHAQQRERIVELVGEISDLKRQLKEYREREGQISSAIISATEKAEKMKNHSKEQGISILDRMLTGIEEQELNDFLTTLDKLTSNMDSVMASLR